MKKNLLMFVMMLALVTACSSQPAADKGSTEAPKPTAAAEEPAELVFYSVSRDSEETFNQRYGDAIRKAFPTYTIKYIQRVPETTDLQQLIASNQRIDIIFDSRASFPNSIIGSDLKFDMTELLQKHNVDLNRFEPSLVDYMKQLGNGAVYGLPLENSTNVIFYNKDIFDKFGVDYPKDGMTWTQLHQIANQLNRESDGAVYTGYFSILNTVVTTNSFSLPTIDAQTKRSTYGDEAWKKVLETEFFATIRNPVAQKAMQQYRKGGVLTLEQFYKEKVIAMQPGGPLVPVIYGDEMSKMNWDMVALPTYEENPGVGGQSYPIYIGITKQAANKDAAMKVLKFLVSDEFQLERSKKGNMTSLNNKDIMKAMGTDERFKGKNYNAFFYNKFAPIPQAAYIGGDVNDLKPLNNKAGKVISGEIDLNTYLRTAEEEVNKAIQSVLQK